MIALRPFDDSDVAILENAASNKTLEANGFTHTDSHYVKDLRNPWKCLKCNREFDYEPPNSIS
ncbi:hypothetical protein FACS1894127_3980 [Clostridia bacterium]|nr:hypothetical protein FACS1894127_3980 [Clostridia bacterium]